MNVCLWSQYIKFQSPNSSDSLIIAIELKIMQIFVQSVCSYIFYTRFLSQNLHIFLIGSSVGIGTGYGLDNQGRREFESL
jgi:hypothetical protein